MCGWEWCCGAHVCLLSFSNSFSCVLWCCIQVIIYSCKILLHLPTPFLGFMCRRFVITLLKMVKTVVAVYINYIMDHVKRWCSGPVIMHKLIMWLSNTIQHGCCHTCIRISCTAWTTYSINKQYACWVLLWRIILSWL